MKVTIGIPTYNRKDLLKVMSNSLYNSNMVDDINIRVYDDCSTEYDRVFLEELFPEVESIKINPININADRNMYLMYVDFLSSGDDYFFNADSDIVFNKNWLNEGLELLKKTDGILSLFNTNSHGICKTINDKLCTKKVIGAAGVLFTRRRIFEIVEYFDSIEKVHSFDWQWCNYFNKKGVLIYCVQNSLIQHIGYDGQNSNLYFDVGQNYKIESLEEGQILNDILVASIDNIRYKEKEREREFQIINAERSNNFKYHFMRCCIILGKKFLPHSWFLKLKQK